MGGGESNYFWWDFHSFFGRGFFSVMTVNRDAHVRICCLSTQTPYLPLRASTGDVPHSFGGESEPNSPNIHPQYIQA